MISNAKLIAMAVPIVFSILLFVGLIIFYRKRVGIEVKPIIVGGIGFIVFTQLLEKILHIVVITNFPNYADYPWLFGLYGGLAAGTFEELGRFLLFTWILKKYQDFEGGISFGIGWGGIEAVFIMFAAGLPNLIFAFMINAGTFESSMASQLPANQITILKNNIINQDIFYYLLGCVERFFAVFMQIAFSLLVLIGVVKKKFHYVLYALLIHAAVDFPLVFFQTGHITNLWVVELYVAIIGIFSFVFIKKAKTILEDF